MWFVGGLRQNPIPPMPMASKISRANRAVTKTIQVPPQNKAWAICLHETSHLSACHRFGTAHVVTTSQTGQWTQSLSLGLEYLTAARCLYLTSAANIMGANPQSAQIRTVDLQTKEKQHRHCPTTKHSCLVPASCGDGCVLYRLCWHCPIQSSRVQTDGGHEKSHGKLPMPS